MANYGFLAVSIAAIALAISFQKCKYERKKACKSVKIQWVLITEINIKGNDNDL